MATIRDVARMARVAPSTVSGVLNQTQTVRPKTRERVEHAIKALGYTHQRVGRPQRDTKRHVAVVTAAALHCLPRSFTDSGKPLAQDDSDAFAGNFDNFLARAVRRAVVDEGHHIHSYAGYRSVREDGMFRESVSSGELDGVILVRETREDGYLDWLLAQGIPLVVVNREPTQDRLFSHVDMDNFGGGRQAAEFFAARSHQRLAVIQADQQYSYNRQRTAGFLAGARAAGVEEPIVAVLENWEQTQQQCKRLLNAGITGLFATTDTLAKGCVDWIENRGIQVPQELSLIGFDDFGFVSSNGLRLSSIAYDVRDLAHVAMRMLDMLCLHRDRLQNVSATVKTRLVEHDTTPSD